MLKVDLDKMLNQLYQYQNGMKMDSNRKNKRTYNIIGDDEFNKMESYTI